MRWNQIGSVWVSLLIAASACGSTEASSGNMDATGNAGVTGTNPAPVGAAGATGTPTWTAGTAAGAPAMGAAGTGMPQFMCPDDPGITSCGAESCPAVSEQLTRICTQTCCTADMRCGTHNAALDTECTPPFTNDTMCPDEMIAGTMVAGCCVEGTNSCGIFDPVLGMGCLARDDFRLRLIAQLAPMNCDGTPVMSGGDAGTGAAGTAGVAGTGAAGTAGAAGSGS
jgi:hypothetical protein